MKPVIFLLLTMVCLLACKKPSQQGNYTGLYTGKQYKIISTPKMYTRNGEVADRASVDRYLNTLPTGSNYFYRNTDTVIAPGNDSIRFISSETGAINIANRRDNRVVKPQGNYLYLYPLDTFRTLGNATTHPFDEAVSKIGIYKPYIKTTCYGNSCIAASYIATMVQWQSGKLSLPLMSYSLIHNEPSGTLYGAGRKDYNNVFDPTVVTLLKDRDTLLVQSAELLFEKAR